MSEDALPASLTRRGLSNFRKSRRNYRRMAWFLPTLIIVMLGSGWLLRETTASGYIVEQHSMEQTLQEGDTLLTNRFAEPQRGDIVVTDGWSSGKNYVKRIVGMPGDQVDYVNGELLLNGIYMEEPFAVKENDNYSITVPEGMYWVLGDNRPVSSDSREHGFVSKDGIKGVAYFRYWPLTRFGTVGGGD